MARRLAAGGPGLLAAALALLAPAAAGAQAPGAAAQQAIAALNAQRAANGIPAGVVENPEYSEGCRLHMAYEAVNGRSPTAPHSEERGRDGYSDLGNRAAGSSVLAEPTASWAAGNPWEDAPFHLMRTLAPSLATTGWAPGCMWVLTPARRPPLPRLRLFTYPGPGAAISPQETAREWPFVPGDLVGLPQGTTTGPHLLVMPFGGAAGSAAGPTAILAAALVGPDGPVEVRTVDQTTSGPRGSLRYEMEGAMITPVAPLRPGTEYTAFASVLAGGLAPAQVRWTFRTSAGAGAEPGVRVGAVETAGDRVRVTLLGAWVTGRPATIALQRLRRVCRRGACAVRPVGRRRERRVTLKAFQAITVPVTRRGYRLTVTAGALRLVRTIR